MKIISYLEKRSSPFWAVVGFMLVGGVGMIDVLTGYELAFSLFYLLPISVTTWYAGKRLGLVVAVASALIWFASDVLTGHPYSHPAIPYWNTMIRFGFFFTTTWLMAALKAALDREQELARIDNLTGAVNKRFFSDLVQSEVDRLRRVGHPFTLAYIDLDNFKTVNDNFGHSMGDQVLSTMVIQIQRQLRKIDVIARLGGDEFALLFPETDQAAAQVVITRLHLCLLETMGRHEWPVTFSIGVVTCLVEPHTIDALIKKADELMYSIKNGGKNAIRYSVYTG